MLSVLAGIIIFILGFCIGGAMVAIGQQATEKANKISKGGYDD